MMSLNSSPPSVWFPGCDAGAHARQLGMDRDRVAFRIQGHTAVSELHQLNIGGAICGSDAHVRFHVPEERKRPRELIGE